MATDEPLPGFTKPLDAATVAEVLDTHAYCDSCSWYKAKELVITNEHGLSLCLDCLHDFNRREDDL